MTQIDVKDLLSELRLICRTCPTPVLIQAYVRAARQLCDGSRWLVQTVTGDTVADQQLYSLGSDPYNEIIGLQAAAVTGPAAFVGPLTEGDSAKWDPAEPTARPELYQYVPHGQFALHPTPDAVYSLSMNVVIQPKQGSTTVPDILVVEWDDALQAGALAYLLKLPRQAWTDATRAADEARTFRAAVNAAASSVFALNNPGAKATGRPGPQGSSGRQYLPI